MSQTPPCPTVLAREYLGLRSLLLEAAAALDRIERSPSALPEEVARLELLRGATRIVADDAGPQRAQRLQLLFSRPYAPDWRSDFGI